MRGVSGKNCFRVVFAKAIAGTKNKVLSLLHGSCAKQTLAVAGGLKEGICVPCTIAVPQIFLW